MGTLEILDAIEEAQGRKEKTAILKANSGNSNLTRTLYYGMNPYMTYWFSDAPTWSSLPMSHSGRFIQFEPFFALLEAINRRQYTGKALHNKVGLFFDDLHPKAKKWFGRVLQKNMRLGISYSSVNKVIPGLVPGFAVQLAHPLKVPLEDLQYPLIMDAKMDGIRCVVSKTRKGVVEMRTRKGFLIDTLPTIKRLFERCPFSDFVIDGEAKGADWNESQSVIGSSVNKKLDEKIVFWAFDYVKLDTFINQTISIPYKDRLVILRKIIGEITSARVTVVRGKVVRNAAEAGALYQEFLDEGHEGGMLKDPNAPYQFTRTKAVQKLKPRESWTGIVVGLTEGTGKHKGTLGALLVSIGGKVTSVGSGFSDEVRRQVWYDPGSAMQKLVEVVGQDMTGDGKIRFPIFKGWRATQDVEVD